MLVAVVTTFRASRKEPLAEVLTRIHGAFLAAGQEPEIQFTFGDAPVAGFVSSVERILKRFPQFQRFVADAPTMPMMPAVRQITNNPLSPAAGEQVPFAALAEIAAGIPRSFPIHVAQFQFRSPAFGEAVPDGVMIPLKTPGVIVGDSWWVNGRSRSVMALTVADAPDDAKEIPAPPAAVASILEACGKVGNRNQIPLPNAATATDARQAVSDPDAMRKVGAIVVDYKARLAEVLERANLPFDLPSPQEYRPPLGQTSGPKKPALARAFKTLGYDCKGESGTFHLRRRTPGNLTAEVYLDVGTWSNSLTGFFEVHGTGFTARLALPPARSAIGNLQFPIGDAERWQQIVANLAALVTELDRTLVPEIEAAAGPAPAWYRP